jgi:UDP-N-acetylmuramoylalanine--D-glutamate ligase
MLKRENILVIGAGESGVGAALLAKKLGYHVFVSDYGKISDDDKNILNKYNIPFEEGGHNLESFGLVQLVIKSPGVPSHAPVLETLRKSRVKIISEIEFGFLHCEAKVLAITGSNGKTTASGLLYHILKSDGKDVAIGGNYGYSFCKLIFEGAPKYIVLEISSFQLDDIDTFRPNVAVILNITPDHLDRYEGKMEKYINAKFRIAENQKDSDFLILNVDNEAIADKIQAGFSSNARIIELNHSQYENGITSKDGDLLEFTLKGRHNLCNALCAVTAARCVGVSEGGIRKGLATFANLPHRLEWVRDIDGVSYINDSKATNVDSVWYALDAMTAPIVWIAGGTDKGNDYTELYPLVEKKVHSLICLGIDNQKLKKAFEGRIAQIFETTKVSEAVTMAREVAKDGDVVLLSPACASFDLFKNYMDRGDQFTKAVLQLE